MLEMVQKCRVTVPDAVVSESEQNWAVCGKNKVLHSPL